MQRGAGTGRKSLRLIAILSYLLIAAATGEKLDPADVDHLKEQIEDKRLISVCDLIKRLPDNWKRNWLPLFGSVSTQPGTRIIFASPDFTNTLTIALPPSRGEHLIEMKIFDREKREFMFSEISFEKERAHFHHNLIDKELRGTTVTCSECHPAGRSRFDLREVLARVHVATNDEAFQDFSRKLEDPKEECLKTLPKYDEFKEASQDFLNRRAREFHEKLAKVSAEVLFTQILKVISKEPTKAPELLAILMNCKNDPSDEIAKRAKTIKTERTTESLHALASIADTSVDETTLARLSLYWDPIVTRVYGENPKAHQDCRVVNWPMSSHLYGYHFAGTYKSYEQEGKKRIGEFIEKKYNLRQKGQTCQSLHDLAEKLAGREGREKPSANSDNIRNRTGSSSSHH